MTAIEERTTIYSLPNEILAQILECLPARFLPPLAGVSRRFCANILRILQIRLLWVAALQGCTLETCLDLKYSQDDYAAFDAEYIDTPGLFAENLDLPEHLARLPTLYSRCEVPNRPSKLSGASKASGVSADKLFIDDKRFIFLHLENDAVEILSILHYYREDSITSEADILSLGDNGFLKFSRDWLNEQVDRHSSGTTYRDEDNDISWVDGEKNIGFKFRVEKWEPEYAEEMGPEFEHWVLIIEVPKLSSTLTLGNI
ncbi:uncharacterized protein TRUGW13939_01142 [Talaromyces rugulosus]|uniref:F-box domain-containing protein n=1 Tax=Talaromyces rugulosus TaxID=121627 RepID=A0A7H8QJE2_TALRU|nr:uncharacterized protein TRUGW13939_01142 [Talaromyces rugulosus]QKX54059.1 hypothetical protein TRUGW13939_01142 [Talaromyces rugulosus]